MGQRGRGSPNPQSHLGTVVTEALTTSRASRIVRTAARGGKNQRKDLWSCWKGLLATDQHSLSPLDYGTPFILNRYHCMSGSQASLGSFV